MTFSADFVADIFGAFNLGGAMTVRVTVEHELKTEETVTRKASDKKPITQRHWLFMGDSSPRMVRTAPDSICLSHMADPRVDGP